MSALVARARGLQARMIGEVIEPKLSPDSMEREVRSRIAADFAILARWAQPDELAVLELDEDRRSLRAIVRGLAAAVSSERRLLATVPTSRLRERTLVALASASSIDEIAQQLTAMNHPLADALTGSKPVIDVLAIEVALTKSYARAARTRTTDAAMREYLAQLIDAENAASAVLLVARGGDLTLAAHHIPGGQRLSRDAFEQITRDNVSDVLAAAFAGTPLAHDITEDAVLAWQLATQRRLRRTDPLGGASVIYAVLSRRAEARRLRRSAWRTVLGGAR